MGNSVAPATKIKTASISAHSPLAAHQTGSCCCWLAVVKVAGLWTSVNEWGKEGEIPSLAKGIASIKTRLCVFVQRQHNKTTPLSSSPLQCR